MSELVFAYRSNMCSGRFRNYGLEPIGSGRATSLDDYQMDFSQQSMKDGSGKGQPIAVFRLPGVGRGLRDSWRCSGGP